MKGLEKGGKYMLFCSLKEKRTPLVLGTFVESYKNVEAEESFTSWPRNCPSKKKNEIIVISFVK